MIRKFRYLTPIAVLALLLYARPLFSGAPVLNVLLHIVCGGGVFSLGRRLGFRSMVAAGLALVFVLHPQQVDVVLAADGWKYILAALLTLAALMLPLINWKKLLLIPVIIAMAVLQYLILFLQVDYFFLPVLMAALIIIYTQRFDGRKLCLWCIPALLPLLFFPFAPLQPWYVVLSNYGVTFWQTLIPLTMPPGLMTFYLMLPALASITVFTSLRRPSFLCEWFIPCLVCMLVSPLLLSRTINEPGYLILLFLWLPAFAAVQIYWREEYKKPLRIGMVIYLLILLVVSFIQTSAWQEQKQIDRMTITAMRDLYPALGRALEAQDWHRAVSIARNIRQNGGNLSTFEDYLYHGIAEFLLKNYSQSEQLFSKALEIAPGNDIATGYLARIREFTGKDPAPSNSTAGN